MKLIFKVVVFFAIIALILYFIGAFLTWNLNPGTWGEDGRFMAVIVLFMLTVFYAANEYDGD